VDVKELIDGSSRAGEGDVFQSRMKGLLVGTSVAVGIVLFRVLIAPQCVETMAEAQHPPRDDAFTQSSGPSGAVAGSACSGEA
jgi:hypothetical protein